MNTAMSLLNTANTGVGLGLVIGIVAALPVLAVVLVGERHR
jgi:hypothetical protein